MQEERNDIHNIGKNYERVLERIRENEQLISEDRKNIIQFVKDNIIGKNSKSKVGKSRLMRYMLDLITLNKYFNKPFLKLTEKDLTDFYVALDNDKIKKQNKQPYSANSKNGFVKTLKKFGRWSYKNNLKKYQKIFGWLKDFKSNDEVSALTRQEIESMAEGCDTRDKAVIMFLFDSGARAEELLNIKLEDLKAEDKYYKVRIKVSKTKPRTIILPIASSSLKAWLKIHPNNDPNSFLFPLAYDSLRKMLYRRSKIINKRVYPHLFRHSSATFYANKYKNPYKMAYRFGWAMNSKEVQRYIDREGIEEDEIKEVMEHDEVETLRKQLKELDEKSALREEYIDGVLDKFKLELLKKIK